MDNLIKMIAVYELKNRAFYVHMNSPSRDNAKTYERRLETERMWDEQISDFYSNATPEERQIWSLVFPAMCEPEKFVRKD